MLRVTGESSRGADTAAAARVDETNGRKKERWIARSSIVT